MFLTVGIMPRPNIVKTLKKEIFDKNKETWYSVGDLQKILDERYAIPTESKNLSKSLIRLTRGRYLIRRRKEKGRDYEYKFRTQKD